MKRYIYSVEQWNTNQVPTDIEDQVIGVLKCYKNSPLWPAAEDLIKHIFGQRQESLSYALLAFEVIQRSIDTVENRIGVQCETSIWVDYFTEAKFRVPILFMSVDRITVSTDLVNIESNPFGSSEELASKLIVALKKNLKEHYKFKLESNPDLTPEQYFDDSYNRLVDTVHAITDEAKFKSFIVTTLDPTYRRNRKKNEKIYTYSNR